MEKKDWYKPGEVMGFSPEHIGFICEWYELLNAGRWPQEYSIYTGNPSNRAFKTDAGFVNPTLVVAEFHYRVGKCSFDGLKFLLVRCYHISVPMVAELTSSSENDVQVALSRVVGYVSGKRKTQTYKEFVKHKGYSRGTV